MNQMEAFRILTSTDRQLVLHELLEGDEGATIEEISQQVAARRHGISPKKTSDTKVEHARVRLVHVHLPKLQGKEIINVDYTSGEMTLVNGEDVDQLFKAATELDSWPPNDLLEHPSRSE